MPGNRGWPDGRVPVSREFVDFNMRKGYKKRKLGANTYWMDKNNNVIEEVIKEEF